MEMFADGRRIVLGQRIGKGGEGEVFLVAGSSGTAAKVYTDGKAQIRADKIEAMVSLGLSGKTSLVAYPTSVLKAANGAFLGFVMKLVANHRPLHDIYSPGSRKLNFPAADFRFLVRTAANVARAVASVHSSGCVIGDINHSSILVSQSAMVALIDADSFQVSNGGNLYKCLVGVPEYTPPELQGSSLPSVVRTPNHDAFGLAVVIFQLLFMGRHPFIGTIRSGDLPSLQESIRDYRFVYAERRNVGMDQPPGTPVLSDMSPGIAQLFECAFSREAAASRPTATQWISELVLLEESLIRCGAESLHYFSKFAAECPWCEMESVLSTMLFLPRVVGALPGAVVDDVRDGSFSVEEILAQVRSMSLPPKSSVMPVLTRFTPQPSEQAVSAAALNKQLPWPRVIAFAISIAVLVAAPTWWMVWVPLGLWSIFSNEGKQPLDTTLFVKKYSNAEERWLTALDAWQRSSGVEDAESIVSSVKAACESFRKLPDEKKALFDAYKVQRREIHLRAYLDGFSIRNAQLKGVGPTRLAALASYGIDTAADVSYEKVLTVPGFAEALARQLVNWRLLLEKRFIYIDKQTESDKIELARLTSKIAAKADALKAEALAGRKQLTLIAGRINAAKVQRVGTLDRLYQEREQARCDLEHLGVPIPTVKIGGVRSATSTVSKSASPVSYGAGASRGGSGSAMPSRTPQPSTVAPNCPRCRAQMVRRTARRGRNAGGSFWGCSRFPICKGTRQI